jgi:thiamine-phosphate pyrophosphorylase
MTSLQDRLLYAIVDTGYVARDSIAAITVDLVTGGADIIQLRAKGSSPCEILAMAREIAPICREAGVPFILNDHPGLVGEAGADGAHVGQEDGSVEEARRLAGPGAIIGKSTHSLEQALAAAQEQPDYIGFGPLFSTPTKPSYTPVGTLRIREVYDRVRCPVFCIGGIGLSNLKDVLAEGARRVVLVSDLLKAETPRSRTAACKSLLSPRG